MLNPCVLQGKVNIFLAFLAFLAFEARILLVGAGLDAELGRPLSQHGGLPKSQKSQKNSKKMLNHCVLQCKVNIFLAFLAFLASP